MRETFSRHTRNRTQNERVEYKLSEKMCNFG